MKDHSVICGPLKPHREVLFTLGSGVGEVGPLILTVLPEGVKLHRQAA